MVAYIHMSFVSNYTVLPRFRGVHDVLSLDVSSQEPLFGTDFHSFRIINAYSTNTIYLSVHSVQPDLLFPELGFPLLVVRDLNMHNPSSDPLHSFSPRQISSSTPYFEKAPRPASYSLIPAGNTPGSP